MKKIKILTVAIALFAAFLAGKAFAFTEFLVPSGVSFTAVTTTEINSNTCNEGDRVDLVLTKDFVYGKNFRVSAGTIVQTTILHVKKSNNIEEKDELELRMSAFVTPSGKTVPIVGSLRTTDCSGILKSSDEKSDEGIVIPANTEIEAVLDRPITVSGN